MSLTELNLQTLCTGPGSLTVAGACQRCGQWRQALLALHQATEGQEDARLAGMLVR